MIYGIRYRHINGNYEWEWCFNWPNRTSHKIQGNIKNNEDYYLTNDINEAYHHNEIYNNEDNRYEYEVKEWVE